MEGSETVMRRAYSPEEFQREGHRLIDRIAAELRKNGQDEQPETIRWQAPEKQLEFWKEEFSDPSEESFSELAEKILGHSVHFHSRGYMGHQVAVTAPVTALTAALTAYMCNSTTVYEIGMTGNAMEKVVLSYLAERYGYGSSATGVVTSGGSLGNLTALVTARTSSAVPERDYHRLVVMVSEEAHYSVERAARVMGISGENILKIPSDERFHIRTDLLEDYYQRAVSAGKLVFCIVGCACTTAVGAYDDLDALADFAGKHQIWFHVDGAHGGAAIFSEKYRHLLHGIGRSDSLIVDFHKMMMAPALSTAVLYHTGHRRVNEFSPHASYLWQDQLSEEWYNSAKHTLECTKPVTIAGTYAILKLYGDALYRENVDMLYDMGREFAAMVKERKHMELAAEPESNIVCFRYVPESGDPDRINKKISEELLLDGTYYIVNTTVRGRYYLRVSLMNPQTGAGDLKGLLDKIEKIAVHS